MCQTHGRDWRYIWSYIKFDLTRAIIISSDIIMLYSKIVDLWSVDYTDPLQLMLIPIGLIIVIPIFYIFNVVIFLHLGLIIKY
jgi:hypothetical protein